MFVLLVENGVYKYCKICSKRTLIGQLYVETARAPRLEAQFNRGGAIEENATV